VSVKSNCKTCTQLDEIQKVVFEKDSVVASLFNRKRKNKMVIMRKPMPILYFKFDHSHLETKDAHFGNTPQFLPILEENAEIIEEIDTDNT
jgi:hypothetical protein